MDSILGKNWKTYFMAGYMSAIFANSPPDNKIESRLEKKIKKLNKRIDIIEARCSVLECRDLLTDEECCTSSEECSDQELLSDDNLC